MQNIGYNYNALHCEQKFRNMRRAYKTSFENTTKSGRERKNCPLFPELHDLFSKWRTYRPGIDNSSGLNGQEYEAGDDIFENGVSFQNVT